MWFDIETNWVWIQKIFRENIKKPLCINTNERKNVNKCLHAPPTLKYFWHTHELPY